MVPAGVLVPERPLPWSGSSGSAATQWTSLREAAMPTAAPAGSCCVGDSGCSAGGRIVCIPLRWLRRPCPSSSTTDWSMGRSQADWLSSGAVAVEYANRAYNGESPLRAPGQAWSVPWLVMRAMLPSVPEPASQPGAVITLSAEPPCGAWFSPGTWAPGSADGSGDSASADGSAPGSADGSGDSASARRADHAGWSAGRASPRRPLLAQEGAPGQELRTARRRQGTKQPE